ncbi:hypothetical protein DMENIID0001_168330 [Sergentomyia squamirostris]
MSLSDDDTGDSSNQSVTASPSASPSAVPRKSIIPPPIVLSDKDPNAEKIISDLRKKFSGNISLSFMSVGIKISPKTTQIYQKILRALIAAKVQHFTHDAKTSNPAKFIIGGLPNFKDTEIEDIKSELSQIYGLQPLEISKILPKDKRYVFDCLYTVSFDRGKVTLADLRKIKSLNSTIIHWSHYKPQEKRPTQCYNCYLFGHGRRNCRMTVRCRICSGQHNEKDCSTPGLPKCRNCGASHTADDSSCPSLTDFTEMRAKLRGGRRLHGSTTPGMNSKSGHQRQSNRFTQRVTNKGIPPQSQAKAAVPKPPSDHRESDSLPRSGPSSAINPAAVSEDYITENFWTSRAAFSSTSSGGTSRPAQRAPKDLTTRSSESQASELFSTEELLCISTELLTGLKGCKCKYDQLQVLFNISLKYLNLNND